jgi:hypothetical protein
MTRDAFEALLTRRDELTREHTTACEILEEEGPEHAHHNYREAARLYDEVRAVQEQIDAALAEERAAENASCNNP